MKTHHDSTFTPALGRDPQRPVWAIPLASKGFVPIDDAANPVRWYIADHETGKVVDTLSHDTKGEAEASARSYGWNVIV